MKLNISIDDACPHPKIGLDAVRRLVDLSTHFDIKVSIFVPTAMHRWGSGDKKPYYLYDYPSFVEEIKKLPNTFEICYHGHKHGNKRTKSNNDEFRYVNEQECYDLLSGSREVFHSVGIDPKPVFRPPGFWMNKRAFKACGRFGIKVLALHNHKRYIKCYRKRNLKFNKIVWPGMQPGTKDMEIYYHAGRDQPDYFDKRQYKRLYKMLSNNKYKYIFMEQF